MKKNIYIKPEIEVVAHAPILLYDESADFVNGKQNLWSDEDADDESNNVWDTSELWDE